MTLEVRMEFLETLREVRHDLATLERAIEDPEAVGEVLGSVQGGVEALAELSEPLHRFPAARLISSGWDRRP
jgi:hypothetical protein